VPNQPKTPGRNVRVPDEEWLAAKKVAADRGESLTDAIRRFLREYVRDHPAGD
jgi:hypothetical protein